MISVSTAQFGNSIAVISWAFPAPRLSVRFITRAFLRQLHSNSNDVARKSAVLHDSLRVLEWDKVCDSVASFAGTPLGREATKTQLWSLNQSYEDSRALLAETNAAVEMLKYGGFVMDLSGIDVVTVKSAIQHVSRGFPVYGNEATAIADLLQFAKMVQFNLNCALKEDADWYNRFMPLSEVIIGWVINQQLVKSIQQVIDENGSVKDSASSSLKRARDRMRMLEGKLYQLMDSIIWNESVDTSSVEVSNIDGRWGIKAGADELTNLKGLLLTSASGVGSLVEPLSAVPLNDELQQARALAEKAEEEVLLRLTEKMKMDLDDIHNLLNSIIQLDVVNARAKYGLSLGGNCPDLFLTKEENGSLTSEASTLENELFKASLSFPCPSEWTVYLLKAFHPLLLQEYQQKLQKARRDVTDAIAVSKTEAAHPVPVDFFIANNTRVLVITGPNTGGKTICLKTFGLAAMMAKSGLYVLASEPVRIPWFDSIFADIGDEQSLSQCLSTFSGHLKQISAIQIQSTNKSLVLLDEVGAGTNPLEGAALGISLLESFADSGALLTVATTHHGELKTLKYRTFYSNDAFENASVEFDEVNLKPTYKILWGVPGLSNAISIAERLGLPRIVLDSARELYGTASEEINRVVIDMEEHKKDFEEHIHEAQHYLILSKKLNEDLLAAERKIMEHGISQRHRKMQEISDAATIACSILRKQLQQHRISAVQPFKKATVIYSQQTPVAKSHHAKVDDGQHPRADAGADSVDNKKQSLSDKKIELPKIGAVVHIPSLCKNATVLKVDPFKEEIVVQAHNMRLKLRLSDVES
ncbi:endonuclease MutS2 isoform X2 [Macadamia integrifolia]|uniref:endonuclease MutS2 isoform X2 n=1 Tax=Macadamia integrifolia TaxID=60698 RepID=UPI001C4E3AB1|nr:endonuclease MutS2 isoform X2 [Macadamia integrifolia]